MDYPQGRRNKNFQEGPIRIEPILTIKNGRIFEFWNVQERVCENPGGGGHGPLADAHDYPCTVFYVRVLKMFRHSHTGNMQLQP